MKGQKKNGTGYMELNSGKKSIKTFKNKTTTKNILTTDHVDKHCFLIIAKCQRVINLE